MDFTLIIGLMLGNAIVTALGFLVMRTLFLKAGHDVVQGERLGAASGFAGVVFSFLLVDENTISVGAGVAICIFLLISVWVAVAVAMRQSFSSKHKWLSFETSNFSQLLKYSGLTFILMFVVFIGQVYPEVFGTYYPTFLRYCAVALSLSILMFTIHRILIRLGVRREAATGYALIMPWVVGFLAFNVFPIGLSFYLSFTEYNILWDKPRGLEDHLFNYRKALSVKIIELEEGERLSVAKMGKLGGPIPESEGRAVRYREVKIVEILGKRYGIVATDAFFWKGLWLTVRYAVFTIPLGLFGALAVALLLNQAVKGVGFWRTLYYLPAVLPAAAVALLWFWLFAPESGLVNWLFNPIYDILGFESPRWFTDEKYILPGFVIMGMWGIFGANTVILLAALKNIPAALFEAASIDGAGTWTKFRRITLPMISPALFYNLVTNTIAALQVFTVQAFIPTDRADGWFINWLIYNEAFNFGRMGYASALGWMLAFLIMVLTLIIFRSSSAWVFYEGTQREEGGT